MNSAQEAPRGQVGADPVAQTGAPAGSVGATAKGNGPAVQVHGLTKYYGKVRALDHVDMTIGNGEYFVLLGPSGGGKTTLLRLIGGFIRPSRGTVVLRGNDVSHLPPEKRPTSMVFQSYALFPHMSVAQNVGFGLKLRKVPAAEASETVAKALSQVSMSGFEERKPWELSGGQQQRVQLARALVLKPQILLLDEPLAALDAQLRKDMCYELKHLQESVGITFVHVTHNQDEAMTVADRVALIADGKLIEEGSTRQIYEQPRDRFTAAFVGERNLFDGRVGSDSAGRKNVALGFTEIGGSPLPETLRSGQHVVVSVRSESVALSQEQLTDPGLVSVSATVREQVYLGMTVQTILTLTNGARISSRALGSAAQTCRPGEALFVSWPIREMTVHEA